jgi:hypothetical protein
MGILYVLSAWIRCWTHHFDSDQIFRGFDIFGAEPDAPRPIMPDVPPIHPCPDYREGGVSNNPFLY